VIFFEKKGQMCLPIQILPYICIRIYDKNTKVLLIAGKDKEEGQALRF